MIIKKDTSATMHVAVVTKFIARKALGHIVAIAIDILLVRSVLRCTKNKQKLVTLLVQMCTDARIVG